MRLMNRKAQGRIGKTLTWFVGFMIIVFTLVLLVLASTILSGSKRITSGWDNIELEKYGLKDLEMQKVLIGLLNKEVEFDKKNISINNLILKFDSSSEKSEIKKVIEEGVGDFFSELGGNYVLVIDTNEQDIDISFIGESTESYRESLLKEGIVFPLILENKNIKLKFYYVRDLIITPHFNVELSLSILKTRGGFKPLLLRSGALLFLL